MDNALRLLGLAKRAGRLEIGEEPVGAVARARKAKLILLAGDAAPNTARRAAHFGEAGNVLFLTVPFTKAELGMAVGRASCALLALTDPGFAAAFVEKLAARDPERYGPAAQQTGEKAARALQRQRERRRHEKKLERGGKKPWAPPPKEEEAPTPKERVAPHLNAGHRPARRQRRSPNS